MVALAGVIVAAILVSTGSSPHPVAPSTPGAKRGYGSSLLSFTYDDATYLAVLEQLSSEDAGSGLLDVFEVTPDEITLVSSSTNLASKYPNAQGCQDSGTAGLSPGFATDGAYFFIGDASPTTDETDPEAPVDVYGNVYVYALANLTSEGVTSVGDAAFVITNPSNSSESNFGSTLAATFVSANSTGYLAIGSSELQLVRICVYEDPMTDCQFGDDLVSPLEDIGFGLTIAFAPGTTTLAVGCKDVPGPAGKSVGAIYLYDVSSFELIAKLSNPKTGDNSNSWFGAYVALSSTTLYTYLPNGSGVVYSFAIDGTTTGPTSSAKPPGSFYDCCCFAGLSVSTDGGTLVVSGNEKHAAYHIRAADGTLAFKALGTHTSPCSTGLSPIAYPVLQATADWIIYSDPGFNAKDGALFYAANTGPPLTPASTPSPTAPTSLLVTFTLAGVSKAGLSTAQEASIKSAVVAVLGVASSQVTSFKLEDASTIAAHSTAATAIRLLGLAVRCSAVLVMPTAAAITNLNPSTVTTQLASSLTSLGVTGVSGLAVINISPTASPSLVPSAGPYTHIHSSSSQPTPVVAIAVGCSLGGAAFVIGSYLAYTRLAKQAGVAKVAVMDAGSVFDVGRGDGQILPPEKC